MQGLLLFVLLSFGLIGQASWAADPAQVLVVVDTSTSMQDPGMDPERASLLVTMLFADLVPGRFAAVRLLDLNEDQALLPHREVRASGCELEGKWVESCTTVESTADWEKDARSKRFGVLERPARGYGAYKRALEAHLEQRAHNSLFYLAFRAAQGTFGTWGGGQAKAGGNRILIWLSDGRPDNPGGTRQVLEELKRSGVHVETVLFGNADTAFAQQAGLDFRRVSSPADMMKTFAGIFRRVVYAPYELDHLLTSNPDFEMKPEVEEAWVVVYGDDTLGEVRVEGPSGEASADYAADRWQGAGAYRVAHLTRPVAGSWQVHAKGGGNTAYAVIQRSSLVPVLLEPGIPLPAGRIKLVVGISAGEGGATVDSPDILADSVVTVEVQGQIVTLVDDGTGGDEKSGDGRFTGQVTMHGSGPVPVSMHLVSPLVDRRAAASIELRGVFRGMDHSVRVDLGSLGVGGNSCRPLQFAVEHEGEVPFELEGLESTPLGHRLFLKFAGKEQEPDEDQFVLAPGDPVFVCLQTAERAPSSSGEGKPWLALRVVGSSDPEQQVVVQLDWKVSGLGFWALWGWLVILLLAIAALIVIILGFVLPERFRRGLAVGFAPSVVDLEDNEPLPIRGRKGTGAGFYRDARAYLHADYRITGKAAGALVGLRAVKGGVLIVPGSGGLVYQEGFDGRWEALPGQGGRGRLGDLYRLGERGPYFRVTMRGR